MRSSDRSHLTSGVKKWPKRSAYIPKNKLVFEMREWLNSRGRPTSKPVKIEKERPKSREAEYTEFILERAR